MEAKDTVMCENYRQMIGLRNKTLDENLETQAELSFKAGREEGYKQGLAMKPNPDGVYENGKLDGRREVVEWINYNHGYCIATMEFMAINKFKWQNQLKEWGVLAP